MNGISCPHCNQLNPDSQKNCERCGQSLLWSVAGSTRSTPGALPKALAYAAVGVLLGIGLARLRPSAQAGLPIGTPAVAHPPRIDVVFAIDATGSMGDEIQVVKDKVSKMMNDIQAGNPKPDVRFGLVAYRDLGDDYVTKAFPLTTAVPSIQSSLQQIEASGGGDTPEAVGEGLRCAVEEINWDQDPNTTRMVFLIGDAGPHPNDNYRAILQQAKEKGIKVNTWGCSGLQDSGHKEFEEIAILGGGQFQFLTYQQEVVRSDGSRARLVFQGSKTYEIGHDVKWSEGADNIKEKAAVDDGMVGAPSAAGGATYRSSEYRPSSQALENNLDTVLVRQVQDEARKRGVAY